MMAISPQNVGKQLIHRPNLQQLLNFHILLHVLAMLRQRVRQLLNSLTQHWPWLLETNMQRLQRQGSFKIFGVPCTLVMQMAWDLSRAWLMIWVRIYAILIKLILAYVVCTYCLTHAVVMLCLFYANNHFYCTVFCLAVLLIECTLLFKFGKTWFTLFNPFFKLACATL